MKEEFVVCKYNEMYEVSNYGVVRSSYRTGLLPGTYGVMKGLLNSCGYRYYSLKRTDIDDYNYGYRHQFSAHRLVYEHFIGDIPEGLEIDHLDGDKLNNRSDNLEAVTHTENVQRSYDRGDRVIVTGADHWAHGVKRSKSTKSKMRQAKLGVNHPKFSGYYVIDGVKYGSSNEAADATGVNSRTVIRWCKEGKKDNCSFEML